MNILHINTNNPFLIPKIYSFSHPEFQRPKALFRRASMQALGGRPHTDSSVSWLELLRIV
jgi:hypothetical protein